MWRRPLRALKPGQARPPHQFLLFYLSMYPNPRRCVLPRHVRLPSEALHIVCRFDFYALRTISYRARTPSWIQSI
jgi:hypothetical protein